MMLPSEPDRWTIDLANAQRMEAIAAFGFTERQARFLLHVLLHSGVFVERQYCAFAGIVHGQKSTDFLKTLVERRFATPINTGKLHRGRMFHVHYKPLWAAIGEPDNRFRKPTAQGRMIERVMLLDAVLDDRELTWLGPSMDKRRHFIRHLGDRLELRDYTVITELAEMGVADHVLESISGHLSRRMLEHYSHIRIDAKRQALDALDTLRRGGDGANGNGKPTDDAEIETIVEVTDDLTSQSRHSLLLQGSPPSGKLLIPLNRRDVRVVEGARLENEVDGHDSRPYDDSCVCARSIRVGRCGFRRHFERARRQPVRTTAEVAIMGRMFTVRFSQLKGRLMLKQATTLAALALILTAAPAMAQDKRVEASVLFGWTFSDGVSGQNVRGGDGNVYNRLDPVDSASWGFDVGGYVNEQVEVGFLFGQQMSTLQAGGTSTRDIGDMTVNTYHGYVAYNMGDESYKVRPYFQIGLGATSYGAVDYKRANGQTGTIAGETQLSTTWGAGIKASVNPNVGVRFGAQWTPTYIKTDAVGTWCDPYWGCYVVGDAQYSNQWNLGGGITFRF